MRSLLFSIGLLLALFIGTTAIAQIPNEKVSTKTPRQQTDEIFSTYMSPFCPGRLLRDCPSSQALELRTKIQEQFSTGQSQDEVVQSLITTYGDEIRAMPIPERFGLVGWLAPFGFFALGMGALGVWLFRKRSNSPSPTSGVPEEELRPEIRQQIERELHEP